jgi:hypothetical protein
MEITGFVPVERATMRFTAVIAVATEMTATALGLALPAHAETGYQFASPSGNVACTMSQATDGDGHVSCDIRDYIFNPPMWCSSGRDLVSFTLDQGQPPQLRCRKGATIDPSLNVVYDQTRSVGLIDCENVSGDGSGAKPHTDCSDRATHHYFRIFDDHYDIG